MRAGLGGMGRVIGRSMGCACFEPAQTSNQWTREDQPADGRRQTGLDDNTRVATSTPTMTSPPDDDPHEQPPMTAGQAAGRGPMRRPLPGDGFAPTERVAPLERFTPTERFVHVDPAAPGDDFAPTERYVPTDNFEPTQRVAPGQALSAHLKAAVNALPLGTMLGEFEILRVLGEGGFGVVYLARDQSLRREVAIKEYMPASLAARGAGQQVVFHSERNRAVFGAGLVSFINEARLLAKFDHPSLVKVYRFWQANGTAYMSMPYYEGATLKETLRQLGGAPDERWLLAFLGALTEALGVIHAERFLHRDIAPDNILLLAGSGRPLLLDFGAARQVIGDATQALTAILKPGFAPVEQYADTPGLRQGPWTDVYALCAVVYTAIMGRKPPVSLARTVNDNYLPLVQHATGRYSERFLAAIDAGLQLQPQKRTASVAALRVSLGLDSVPLAAGPTPAASPTVARPSIPVAPPMPMPSAGVARISGSPVWQPANQHQSPTTPTRPSLMTASDRLAATANSPTKRSERAKLVRWGLGWLSVAAAAAIAAGVFMWWIYPQPRLKPGTALPAKPGSALAAPAKAAPSLRTKFKLR